MGRSVYVLYAVHTRRLTGLENVAGLATTRSSQWVRRLTLRWASMRVERGVPVYFVAEVGKVVSPAGCIMRDGWLWHTMTEGVHVGLDLHCHSRVVQAFVSSPLCLNSTSTYSSVRARCRHTGRVLAGVPTASSTSAMKIRAPFMIL